MANWGLRVSQDGYDVLADADDKMIFTPTRKPLKVIASGTFSLTLAAGVLENYIDIYFGIDVRTSIYTFMFVDAGDGVLRRNPGVFTNTNYIGGLSYARYLTSGGGIFTAGIELYVQRTTSSTTYPAAVTLTGTYFALTR